MNSTPLHAVLFDMGGTLEEVYYDDNLRMQATQGFRDILVQHSLEPGISNSDLYALIKAGMKKYQDWRLETEREMPPEQLWGKFVFTDLHFQEERLASIGEELALYWDERFSKRTMRPEVPALLATLKKRGLRMGVISNITSRGFVPRQIAKYGIASYFDAVIASAAMGWRKPNPCIFVEAARQLGVAPSQCAYVGDTISRDVIGARRAGYALAIQIKSFLTTKSDGEHDVTPPDAVVQDLSQVADVIDHSHASLV